jgi:hypothetical protein
MINPCRWYRYIFSENWNLGYTVAQLHSSLSLRARVKLIPWRAEISADFRSTVALD